MKTKPTIALLLALFASLCLATQCKKKEDYYAVTYYPVTGVGYVFMYDKDGSIMYPIQGTEIEVTTDLGYSGGLFSPPPKRETFITDTTGKYQVRFIKRTQLRDATRYIIKMVYYTGSEGNPKIFFADEVKNAQNNIILIDTIRVSKVR